MAVKFECEFCHRFFLFLLMYSTMFFVTIEDLRVMCLLISVICIVYRVSELDIFENLFKTEYEAR